MKTSSRLVKKIAPEIDLEEFSKLPSGSRGARAKKIVLEFLSKHGFRVDEERKRGHYDGIINEKNIIIRFSTIWKKGKGHYAFQQIKEGNWCYLLCIGMSSSDDHLWIMSHEDMDKIPGQHTGMEAKETRCIRISPKETKPDYLEGGTLEEGLKAIHDALD